MYIQYTVQCCPWRLHILNLICKNEDQLCWPCLRPARCTGDLGPPLSKTPLRAFCTNRHKTKMNHTMGQENERKHLAKILQFLEPFFFSSLIRCIEIVFERHVRILSHLDKKAAIVLHLTNGNAWNKLVLWNILESRLAQVSTSYRNSKNCRFSQSNAQSNMASGSSSSSVASFSRPVSGAVCDRPQNRNRRIGRQGMPIRGTQDHKKQPG